MWRDVSVSSEYDAIRLSGAAMICCRSTKNWSSRCSIRTASKSSALYFRSSRMSWRAFSTYIVRSNLDSSAAQHQAFERHSLDMELRDVEQESVEHDLNQWRMVQASFRLQLLDELLERQLLMLDRIQDDRASTVQQFRERWPARHIDPNRERIDEEPEQLLCLELCASRDWGAEHDVVLAADAV